MLRNKVVLSRNADAMLRGRAATGIFRVYRDDSAAIFRCSDPTHYEVMHELMHYRHFIAMGASALRQFALVDREQYVYDALRSKYWRTLNPAERRHAIDYIRRLGGKAW